VFRKLADKHPAAAQPGQGVHHRGRLRLSRPPLPSPAHRRTGWHSRETRSRSAPDVTRQRGGGPGGEAMIRWYRRCAQAWLPSGSDPGRTSRECNPAASTYAISGYRRGLPRQERPAEHPLGGHAASGVAGRLRHRPRTRPHRPALARSGLLGHRRTRPPGHNQRRARLATVGMALWLG
jgi:hypothetical protein